MVEFSFCLLSRHVLPLVVWVSFGKAYQLGLQVNEVSAPGFDITPKVVEFLKTQALCVGWQNTRGLAVHTPSVLFDNAIFVGAVKGIFGCPGVGVG